MFVNNFEFWPLCPVTLLSQNYHSREVPVENPELTKHCPEPFTKTFRVSQFHS